MGSKFTFCSQNWQRLVLEYFQVLLLELRTGDMVLCFILFYRIQLEVSHTCQETMSTNHLCEYVLRCNWVFCLHIYWCVRCQSSFLLIVVKMVFLVCFCITGESLKLNNSLLFLVFKLLLLVLSNDVDGGGLGIIVPSVILGYLFFLFQTVTRLPNI